MRYQCKLTPDDVRQIRALREEFLRLRESCSLKALAAKFEIDEATVGHVTRYESYKWVR